jgi:AAA+ superfamily predicted ATPase
MANDVGEIRRILNSFLLMIEQDDSNSVIVAATNHPDILDEALFRRFDDVVEYHIPSTVEVQALLRMRLAVYVKSKKDIADLATESTGLRHAEISRAIDDAVKEAVMHDQEIVPAEALRTLLQQRQQQCRRTATSKE